MDLERSFKLHVKSHKLKTPYKLSFGTIREIDSVQVAFTQRSRTTVGEVVPLVGYNDESTESISKFIKQKLSESSKFSSLQDFRAHVAQNIRDHGFACSPILCAIDLHDSAFTESMQKSKMAVDEFVVPTSTSNATSLREALHENLNRFVKIKLSSDPEHDFSVLSACEAALMACSKPIRLDANQALNLDQARFLYRSIENSNFRNVIHYIEQALPFDDWQGSEVLANEFELPTMLDESVVLLSDVEKAQRIGVQHIKLKLFKQGGLVELEQMIQKAVELDMRVILGNGVSTEIGNDMENYFYLKFKGKIVLGSEANGFAKI